MYKITNKKSGIVQPNFVLCFFYLASLTLGMFIVSVFLDTYELTVANNGPCTICPADRQELTYNFFRIFVIFGIFTHKSRMSSSL
jgi:hypothetical protein